MEYITDLCIDFNEKMTYDSTLNLADKFYNEHDFKNALYCYLDACEFLIDNDNSRTQTIILILEIALFCFKQIENFNENSDYYDFLSKLAHYYRLDMRYEQSGDMYVEIAQYYSEFKEQYYREAILSYSQDNMCGEKLASCRNQFSTNTHDHVIC